MRILFTLLLGLSLLACYAEKEMKGDGKIIVKGEVFDTLLLNLYEYQPFGQKKFAIYKLDAPFQNENILKVPDSICNRRLFLSFNNMFTFIEIKPGQELIIDADDSKMSFSGDNAKVNQYLYDWVNEYIMGFPNAYTYRLYLRNFFCEKKKFVPTAAMLEEGINEMEGLNKRALQHLNDYGIKDKAFIKKQKLFIKYLDSRILLENFFYLKNLKEPLSPAHKKYFQDIEFSDMDFLEHPDAREMLNKYFAMLEHLGELNSFIPYSLLAKAEKLKLAELQELYVLEQLERLVRGQKSFMLDAIFENVSPLVKSESGKATLEKLKKDAAPLKAKEMIGKDAFEFNMEDDRGKLVKMSDFKGKYVFIDIWATWCGPCNVNIPFVNMLEHELKDENIAFVSISIDKPSNKQKWLDFLKKHHIEGTALIAEAAFKSELCKYYKVNSIPRFILVDPQGKIISANCRQPMDADFRAYLIDFIKRNK